MNRVKTTPLQPPPKMKIKRSAPNISSSKLSCEYAGCKNTTSKSKRYCGLHYPDEISSYMHKCESCGIMISQKKQLCKPCKRISNLGIERMNKGRDLYRVDGGISKKEKEFQKFKEWEQRAFERLRNPPRYPTAPNSEEEDYASTDEQSC